VDLSALVDASLAMAGDQAKLPQACLDQVTGMIPAWTAGSARAGDSALIFESTMPTVGAGASGLKGTDSAIAKHLPATTVAAIEVRDLGPRVVDAVDALKKALACEPGTADAIKQVEQALAAVGGVEALVGWAGDSAVAVEAGGGTLGGGLAATVTDEAAAGRTLDQVQALLALGGAGAGITSTKEAYGDGEILVITIPSQALPSEAAAVVPKIGVTIQRGIFVLGTIDFVKHVVDTTADASLASSDRYKRAIETAGGAGISDVFVDIAGIRSVVETMIPAAEKAKYDTEVKPFLLPFEAFASVAEAPGDTTVSRAVVTFTK
jgi:hypothetical protein